MCGSRTPPPKKTLPLPPLTPPHSEEQQNIMITLGYCQDEQLVHLLLEWALFSGEVRIQDVSHALSLLGSSSESNSEIAFAFLSTEFERIVSKFAKGPMYGICMMLLCRGGSSGSSKCARIDAFFETHDCRNGKKRILQAKEGLVLKSERLQRDRPLVKEWAEKRQ